MASQRHKCEIRNFTVIADGTCPAYSVITYPLSVSVVAGFAAPPPPPPPPPGP